MVEIDQEREKGQELSGTFVDRGRRQEEGETQRTGRWAHPARLGSRAGVDACAAAERLAARSGKTSAPAWRNPPGRLDADGSR